MQLVGDDSVLDEEFERNDLQGVLMGSFKDDRAASARLLDLQPARGADAPAVAGLEAGEAVLRQGSGEVVAEGFRGVEERPVDDAADGVDAKVFRAGVAAASTVEAGHGIAAAGAQRLAKDVTSV